MKTPMRDLIVVLPGILGSTLANQDEMVWGRSDGAVLRSIYTFLRNKENLTLPDGVGDEHPNDGVKPVGLMPDLHALGGIWTVNLGYSTLISSLKSQFCLIDAPLNDPDRYANFLPIPYDWRLSNRYNGRRLKTIVEPALEKWRSQSPEFKDAKVIFICHSMGGLVARWYIDLEGGAEITRKLITLGTPHRGALKALKQLVNGIQVKSVPQPFLNRFARSLPSLHQLLPEYACLDMTGGLLKISETTLPDLDTRMTSDAMLFHRQLNESSVGNYQIHPIVGFRQPTDTTAIINSGRIVSLNTIGGNYEGGDGTVPRLSATPKALNPDDPSAYSVADQHGALQYNQGILDQMEFVLSGRREPHRAGTKTELAVAVDDWVMAGEPIELTATLADESRLLLQATVRNEAGNIVKTTPLTSGQPGSIDPLAPGGYTITVTGVGSAVSRLAAVTCPILVWQGDEC